MICLQSGRTPLVMAGGDPRFVVKIKQAGGDFGQSQCGGMIIFIEIIFHLYFFKSIHLY